MAYAHLVKPGSRVNLADIDPDHHGGLDKSVGQEEIVKIGRQMADLQELLYAARLNSLLIVLQGRDTSGKDGAIRSLLSYVNVQSCRVAAFKVPTPEEAAHDFLWRVHSKSPGCGDIAIFNRSHYEDVLAARVHELVPKHTWKDRYAQINEFESLLSDAGTLVVKFYLHISKDEQEARLLEREKEPEKSWKLSVGDWKERLLWDDYTTAYEDALSKCSTESAPWRIVPANHKWFRDLAIAEAVLEVLEPYEDEWKESLVELGKRERAELDAFRKQQSA